MGDDGERGKRGWGVWVLIDMIIWFFFLAHRRNGKKYSIFFWFVRRWGLRVDN